ncbi:MAG: PQQ-binding-like beta-propeller repeat protein, partial [Candidatus Altiarchaeota archaeon]
MNHGITLLTATIMIMAAIMGVAQNYEHVPVWTGNLGGRIGSIKKQNDTIIVASGDRIACLNQNGRLKWEHATGNIVNSIMFYGDRIIASSTDHTTYMFSREGRLLWKAETPGYVGYDNALDARDGRILAGSVNGNAYMYDDSGNLLWEYYVGGYVMAVRILEDSTVVVSDRQALILDLEGEVRT